MAEPHIVWLRRDLRLSDQAAFAGAAASGAPVIAVYVLDDGTPGDRKMGGAARVWLHASLEALARDLGRHGSRLILRRGRAVAQIAQLAEETGARTVHALRHYEPWWRKAEGELGERLELCLHDGNYLLPPGAVTTGAGEPFKIYTPFMKAMLAAIEGGEGFDDPPPEPKLTAPATWPASDALDDWGLIPSSPDWSGGIRQDWQAGTRAALERFDDFLDDAAEYATARNLPSIDGSSRMSPHLHHGEVSPRMLWQRLAGRRGEGPRIWRSELIWRDFSQNLVAQFPDYPSRSYRDTLGAGFWRDPALDAEAADDLAAWQQGRTGYPIVDAGMRQLGQTGWMHNRVRMIAASFLIKHLLIDWRHGERWFWDTLIDADYGNNGTNWQWVSGTGVDSSMFVRIMNPLSQSEKFAAGDYIRRFVPELAGLGDAAIHDPAYAERPPGYPAKRIGHREARERALSAYRDAKAG